MIAVLHMPINAIERSIYEFSLRHLESEKARLEELIAGAQSQVGATKAIVVDPSMPEWVMSAAEHAAIQRTPQTTAQAGKRVLSPEARNRIAAAQRKRWAEFHKSSEHEATAAPAAKSAPQKRAISAEGKARIVAALKKRWAKFHKTNRTK